MRTEKIEIRLTNKEKQEFIDIQKKLGYSSISEMIRHVFFDLSKKMKKLPGIPSCEGSRHNES